MTKNRLGNTAATKRLTTIKESEMSDFINWEKWRKADGNIDLLKAFNDIYAARLGDQAELGIGYLVVVELNQPIISRQAAAVALATAYYLASGEKA